MRLETMMTRRLRTLVTWCERMLSLFKTKMEQTVCSQLVMTLARKNRARVPSRGASPSVCFHIWNTLTGRRTTEAMMLTTRLNTIGLALAPVSRRKFLVAKDCRVLMKAAKTALTNPAISNLSSVTALRATPTMIGTSVNSVLKFVRLPFSRYATTTANTGVDAFTVCVSEAGTLLKLKYVRVRETTRVTAHGKQRGAARFNLVIAPLGSYLAR
mmetsp:Transcript_16835/g.34076  ORF Transcript_16835/g.34076 Transcript_16835/m.34076 type:complete len:214 (-) Transcript_16835:328-969(-)